MQQALAQKVKKQLVLLKGGSFEMGDFGGPTGLPYDTSKDSKPLHKVTLDGFYIQPYKVTYEEFDLFTDDTGKERVDMDNFGLAYRSPKSPAGVSWYGAQAYCTWLGKLTHLPFTLPSEAQWEYAARSGGKRVLFATDDGDIPKRGKNYPLPKNSDLPLPPVGSYPPNSAGLYDMSGDDIYEWVNDWYDENYYKSSPEHNPQGPKDGTHKVIRGGSAAVGEQAGLVFTKWKAPLIRLKPARNSEGKLISIPYTGYSSEAYDTFRCVVNAEHLP
jgi:formylglycine-generating enzyme required for sulfatase activity